MVHRQYLLGVELKQQRPQLVSTIAATTATTTTTILTQTHFEWNFSLTHFNTHTRTYTRATTDTHNWIDNNTVGGIGKSNHQRPWLRFLLVLVRSSTNKQVPDFTHFIPCFRRRIPTLNTGFPSYRLKKSNNVHVSPGKAEWGRRNSSGGGGKAGKQTFSTLHGKQKIASAATSSDRSGIAYSFSFVRLQ